MEDIAVCPCPPQVNRKGVIIPLGMVMVSDAFCSTAVYTTPLTRNTSQIFLMVFDDVPVDVSVNGQRPNQISQGVLLPGTCLLL